ncbi:hypothetical protein HK100_007703 [Physocladia obscura]|uniref:Uncharacterized protein n=1 Tax=Physocladia obscura TaxID=109957 RepID=A0AAD5XFR0_9FUNG|nr:hypothetical protein HK100_007703 [Physocladia obscura]
MRPSLQRFRAPVGGLLLVYAAVVKRPSLRAGLVTAMEIGQRIMYLAECTNTALIAGGGILDDDFGWWRSSAVETSCNFKPYIINTAPNTAEIANITANTAANTAAIVTMSVRL